LSLDFIDGDEIQEIFVFFVFGIMVYDDDERKMNGKQKQIIDGSSEK
jgi:hypothetical protein